MEGLKTFGMDHSYFMLGLTYGGMYDIFTIVGLGLVGGMANPGGGSLRDEVIGHRPKRHGWLTICVVFSKWMFTCVWEVGFYFCFLKIFLMLLEYYILLWEQHRAQKSRPAVIIELREGRGKWQRHLNMGLHFFRESNYESESSSGDVCVLKCFQYSSFVMEN